MREKLGLLVIGCLFCVQADTYFSSSYDARYSLEQNQIQIEAGSMDEFEPYTYLLKNRHALDEEDQKRFVIQGEVDLSSLGTYEIRYGSAYVLQVAVKDTTPPELKLKTMTISQNEAFQWNEERLHNVIENVHDNYTEEATLMKEFRCDPVDTSVAGQHNVDCLVKDESGNEKTAKLNVQISASMRPNASVASSNTNKPNARAIPAPAYSGEELAQIQQIGALVNQIRAEHGVPPVTLDLGNYHGVTYQRTQEVLSSYSHTRPNGQPCYSIFAEYGLGYHSSGENIGKGQQSAEEVVKDWMNSPSHRENILRSEFTTLSVGVAGSGGNKIWVQEFFS